MTLTILPNTIRSIREEPPFPSHASGRHATPRTRRALGGLGPPLHPLPRQAPPQGDGPPEVARFLAHVVQTGSSPQVLDQLQDAMTHSSSSTSGFCATVLGRSPYPSSPLKKGTSIFSGRKNTAKMAREKKNVPFFNGLLAPGFARSPAPGPARPP
jgi:hypothetical protein